MNKTQQLTKLRVMRIIATSLLLAMAVLYAVARTLEITRPAWGYIRAFAEASMVGALADWFAVVALFRHPLGLPIPHTAIIPKNKGRIGQSLGRFITEKFLTTAALRPRLDKLDLVGDAAGWLTKNSDWLTEKLTAFIPQFLRMLDNEAIRKLLHQQLVDQLQTVQAAPLAGKILQALTEGDKHKALLCELLKLIHGWMRDNEDQIRQGVLSEIKIPNFPIIASIKYAIAAQVANKIVAKAATLAHDLSVDPDHRFHSKFKNELEQFITKLKNSPELLQKGEEIKSALLQHPLLLKYLQEVWTTVEKWIAADLAKPDSQIRAHLRNMLNGIGQKLQSDVELRNRINDQLRNEIVKFAEQNKEQVTNFIQETVERWDAREITENLETEVGSDLQFIRINGTVVGGLVGVALHFLSLFFWGL